MFGLLARRRFKFFDPGPLVDGNLKLIAPKPSDIDDILVACQHPLTLEQAPDLWRITRQSLLQFLDSAPDGHQPARALGSSVPSYHFWMRLENGPLTIAGGIGLRIGDNRDLRNYIGHIGYNVYPPARGQHLAERSARLLLPLARRHGLRTIWITANPDNHASRRTCQRLGARFVDTVTVPSNHDLFARGEYRKCRYRIDL